MTNSVSILIATRHFVRVLSPMVESSFVLVVFLVVVVVVVDVAVAVAAIGGADRSWGVNVAGRLLKRRPMSMLREECAQK